MYIYIHACVCVAQTATGPPAYPGQQLSYSVCASTRGAPDTARVLQCAGCAVQPAELSLGPPTPSAGHSRVLSLYLDPEEPTGGLVPGALLYLVLTVQQATPVSTLDRGPVFSPLEPSKPGPAAAQQQYMVGTAAATATSPVMWTRAGAGAWTPDTQGRTSPLVVSMPVPPAGFSPNQLHRDWIAFSCAVNAW